jgi:hypothetical protein
LLALVVVGLSVGLGVSLLREQLDRDKTGRTLANTERVAQALGAFVAANKRLPCAANPDASPLLGAEVDGASCTSANARGLVPWATLGLQRRDVEDGYGRLLTYHVDPAFASGAAATLSALCSTAATEGLQTYVSASGTLAAPVVSNRLLEGQTIGFVLLSHGPNGFGARYFDATTLTARPLAAAPDTLLPEALNARGSRIDSSLVPYIDRDPSLTEADGFDDLLFYKSLPTFVALYSASVC